MKNKRAQDRGYVVLTRFEGSISFNPITKSRCFESVGLCTLLISMRFDPRCDKETSSYTVLITVAHVGDRKESARKSIRSHLLNGCNWNVFRLIVETFSVGIDRIIKDEFTERQDRADPWATIGSRQVDNYHATIIYVYLSSVPWHSECLSRP